MEEHHKKTGWLTSWLTLPILAAAFYPDVSAKLRNLQKEAMDLRLNISETGVEVHFTRYSPCPHLLRKTLGHPLIKHFPPPLTLNLLLAVILSPRSLRMLQRQARRKRSYRGRQTNLRY
jgi:hypothetical protein